MNEQRTSYGAEDKCSLVQQICVYIALTFLVRKTGPIHLGLVPYIRTSGSYNKLAGQ